MDITRGSLEDITRPARTHRYRPGSRVSLHSFSGLSSPVSRPTSHPGSSLEILPPDPDILLQEDNDLAVVEYLSSSEEDSNDESDKRDGQDDDDDGEIFHPEGGTARIDGAQDRIRSLDLLIANTDGGGNDNSDLSLLSRGVHRVSNRSSPAAGVGGRPSSREEGKEEEKEDADADLAGIADPELRRAIKKMRKLDRILSTKVTREREVKRQRKLLHHHLEVELDSIKEEGGGRSKEATENTTRFLALVPPVSHDEGINTEDIPSTPVFATQPPEGSPARKVASSSNQSSPRQRSGRQKRRSSKTSPRVARGQRRPRPPGWNGGGSGSHGRKEDEPDFIQRNIDLAQDAGNLIAMTDDEKKRLEDLLQDVEMLGVETDETSTGRALQLKSAPGVGYKPQADDQKLLQEIDEKLKGLLPAHDFTTICSTPSLLGERRESFNPEAFDLGERILRNTKETRSHQERLRDIERELAHLQTQVEEEISSPSLSKAQLNALLQRCSEASDRTMTEITSPRSPRLPPCTSVQSHSSSSSPGSASESSPRAVIETGASAAANSLDQKLSNDALQQLLSEARASLGLLALENASSRATSRTETVVTTGRDPSDQLVLSLGDSPRSELGINTSMSLVSHDMIQQLLRNPRATMLQYSHQEIDDQAIEHVDVSDEAIDDDEFNASMDR